MQNLTIRELYTGTITSVIPAILLKNLQQQRNPSKKVPPAVNYKDLKSVEEVDWDGWEPEETAVICYIFKDNKVLLINKKTGLGKGKVNAPGGRIEAGEMPMEAAVRETREETGLTPLNLKYVAQLSFIFTDGYSLKGFVYFADDCSGELKETDEADPFWQPSEAIPYEKCGRMIYTGFQKLLKGIL